MKQEKVQAGEKPEKKTGKNLAEAAEKRRQSQQSILRYGAALLIVAFALVLVSYLTQLRAARDELSNASEASVSALKTVGDLREENERLRNEAGALEVRIAELTEELGAERVRAESLDASLHSVRGALNESENTAVALARLREVAYLFNRGQITDCRAAVETFEAAGLKQYLSPGTEGEEYSPLEQYEYIYNQLYK